MTAVRDPLLRPHLVGQPPAPSVGATAAAPARDVDSAPTAATFGAIPGVPPATMAAAPSRVDETKRALQSWMPRDLGQLNFVWMPPHLATAHMGSPPSVDPLDLSMPAQVAVRDAMRRASASIGGPARVHAISGPSGPLIVVDAVRGEVRGDVTADLLRDRTPRTSLARDMLVAHLRGGGEPYRKSVEAEEFHVIDPRDGAYLVGGRFENGAVDPTWLAAEPPQILDPAANREAALAAVGRCLFPTPLLGPGNFGFSLGPDPTSGWDLDIAALPPALSAATAAALAEVAAAVGGEAHAFAVPSADESRVFVVASAEKDGREELRVLDASTGAPLVGARFQGDDDPQWLDAALSPIDGPKLPRRATEDDVEAALRAHLGASASSLAGALPTEGPLDPRAEATVAEVVRKLGKSRDGGTRFEPGRPGSSGVLHMLPRIEPVVATHAFEVPTARGVVPAVLVTAKDPGQAREKFAVVDGYAGGVIAQGTFEPPAGLVVDKTPPGANPRGLTGLARQLLYALKYGVSV